MSLKFHVYFTLDSTSSFLLATFQVPTSHTQPYCIVLRPPYWKVQIQALLVKINHGWYSLNICFIPDSVLNKCINPWQASFYRWEIWGTGRLRNITRATRLVSRDSGFKLGHLAIECMPLITCIAPLRQKDLPSPQMDHFCVFFFLVPSPESSFSPIDFFLLNFHRSPHLFLNLLTTFRCG